MFFAILYGDKIKEEINVNAKLTPSLFTTASIEIYGQEEIKGMNIKDLSQLLSYIVGVDVKRKGASGSSWDIGIRGSNFEQTTIMINGIKYNNPQTGHLNTSLPISVDQIERVEVIHEGGSVLYGANAYSGAINFILKKNSSSKGLIKLSGGSNKTYGASANVFLGNKKFSNNISLQGFRSDGYDGGLNYNKYYNLFYNGCYENDKNSINFQGSYLYKDFGAYGFYAPLPSKEKIKSAIFSLEYLRRLNKGQFKVTFSNLIQDDYFELDRYRPQYFMNSTLSKVYRINSQYIQRGKRTRIIVGTDLMNEDMDSENMNEHSRTGGAIFGSLRFKGNFFLYEGGARYFINNDYKKLNYYLGVGKKIEKWHFSINYGTAFRLPSFTELYYHSPSNIGDDNLSPESSKNLGFNIKKLCINGQVNLSFFYRKQDNMIDWVKDKSKEPWRVVNSEQYDMGGITISRDFILGNNSIRLSVEGCKPFDVKKPKISKYGMRFPEFMTKLNYIRRFGRDCKVFSSLVYKKLYNVDEKGWFLDIGLKYQLNNINLSVSFDNILNCRMEEIKGLRAMGRQLLIGVGWEIF